MKLKIYQIDAFANRVFEGNPAVVCPLDSWIDDELMQKIAMENNLSESAFFVKNGDKYDLRWFTPKAEVDMCGHATLASAYVLFECMGYVGDVVRFRTKSGELIVRKERDIFVMDFPLLDISESKIFKTIEKAFGKKPKETFRSMDHIVVFDEEDDVLNAKVDLNILKELDLRGVIIMAKSKSYDFVLRFFAPKLGVDEDPVTGSAFTQVARYWSSKLEKSNLLAKQLSCRGGEVGLSIKGDRVEISGNGVLYMVGEIEV